MKSSTRGLGKLQPVGPNHPAHFCRHRFIGTQPWCLFLCQLWLVLHNNSRVDWLWQPTWSPNYKLFTLGYFTEKFANSSSTQWKNRMDLWVHWDTRGIKTFRCRRQANQSWNIASDIYLSQLYKRAWWYIHLAGVFKRILYQKTLSIVISN